MRPTVEWVKMTQQWRVYGQAVNETMVWSEWTSGQRPVMFCAICYHLYNFKNVKTTLGGVLLLVTTLLKVTLLHECFSRFFKLYKLYQIAQRIIVFTWALSCGLHIFLVSSVTLYTNTLQSVAFTKQCKTSNNSFRYSLKTPRK